MPMSRFRWIVPAILLLMTASPGAARAERVPLVPPDRLPVVGTCAPIAEGNVTHVLTAPPETEGWWFRVAGLGDPLDEARLSELLAARVGTVPTGGRTEHAVWITAAADHKWAHVVKVLIACDRVGIYRVGLRVRSDAAPGVFGFPLFFPPPRDPTAAPSGQAVGLDVRLQTVADRTKVADAPGLGADVDGVSRSNPALVYTAARRAVERHGAVVATTRLATNATVQEALTVLDALYRAGVAGIRMPMRALAANPRLAVFPVVWVNGVALGTGAPPVPPERIAPRAEPWGLHGANRPGWLDFTVVEESALVRDAALRSWIAQGRMPPYERERAGAALAEWGADLGNVLSGALRGQADRLAAYLAPAARSPEASSALRARLAREGAGIESALPTSVQVTLVLEQAGNPVGRVDALVHLGSTRAGLVWMRWAGPQPVEGAGGAPTGIPAELRLFLEGELLALKAGGPAACTWAEADDVVRGFPLVAREGIQRLFTGRVADAGRLQQALANMPFDAARIRPGQVSAALSQGGRVVGVAYLQLDIEDEGLLIRDAELRRAE